MPATATMCPNCKGHRSRWRNELEYWARNGTLVVAVLSGLAWLWLNAIRPLLSTDEVRVVSCDSSANAIVVYRGERGVFVSHIFMQTDRRVPQYWRTRRVKFEQSLAPGQFAKQEFPPRKIVKAEIVRGLTDTEFEELLVRAAKDEDCYELIFYAEKDPFARELMQMGGRRPPNRYTVTAYVEYYPSGHASDVKQESFPAFGILHRAPKRECYTAVDLQRLKRQGVALPPEAEEQLRQDAAAGASTPVPNK